MKRRSLAQELDVLRAQTQRLTDFSRGRADALGVLEGVVVAILGGNGEPLENLRTGIVELTRFLGHLRFEQPGAVGKL